MPEENYVWLPRGDLLHFGETATLLDAFLALGVTKVRLTGGEPLLRKDVHRLVERIACKPGVRDLALTTNGVLLASHAETLRQAGLHRVTVSLDTLKHDRFKALARFDELDRVLEGIAVAGPLFPGLKIDTVLIRGVNDDELIPMLEFGRERGAEVRFIEYMDVGGATTWSLDQVVTRKDILATLEAAFGPIEPVIEESTAPADRFRLPDGTVFGIIASTTEPFCRTCDRARLTSDGLLLFCLYAKRGLDLRTPLRANASLQELAAMIAAPWQQRSDRGAEDRLAQRKRDAFIPADSLRRDPHLEMHTRGG